MGRSQCDSFWAGRGDNHLQKEKSQNEAEVINRAVATYFSGQRGAVCTSFCVGVEDISK